MGMKIKMNELPLIIKILAILGFIKVQKTTSTHERKPIEYNKHTTRHILIIVFLIGIGGTTIYLLSFGLADNPYEGMTPIEKDIRQQAIPYEDLIVRYDQESKDLIESSYKGMVEYATCGELLNMYKANPGWSIRPYIAFLIVERDCDV